MLAFVNKLNKQNNKECRVKLSFCMISVTV